MDRLLTAPWPLLVTGLLVLGVLSVLFACVILKLNDRRWQEILTGWLQRQGYHLVSAQRRSFTLGPFTWTTWRGRVVYFVTVSSSSGVTRRGWVRLSDPFGGPVDGKVEVSWET
jgi:hypothetical protein